MASMYCGVHGRFRASVGQEAARAGGVIPSMRASVRGGELLDEVVDENGDIGSPGAERRQIDRDDAKAVVEVLAEFPVLDQVLEVAVRGGDQAHIDGDRDVGADAVHAALFEDAQELGPASTSGMSPISSRSRVPWLANSNRPLRAPIAPVKAPFRGRKVRSR